MYSRSKALRPTGKDGYLQQSDRQQSDRQPMLTWIRLASYVNGPLLSLFHKPSKPTALLPPVGGHQNTFQRWPYTDSICNQKFSFSLHASIHLHHYPSWPPVMKPGMCVFSVFIRVGQGLGAQLHSTGTQYPQRVKDKSQRGEPAHSQQEDSTSTGQRDAHH